VDEMTKNAGKVGMKYKKHRGEVVKDSCANYDSKTGHCLLIDKACPLVPFSYRGHVFPTEEAECNYFDKYVLGVREELATGEVPVADTEALPQVITKVTGKGKVIYSYRECALCGDSFKPTNSRNKYCGKNCTSLARKSINNRYYTTKN
jgi:hypothetical protein